jgi:peptidoglycan/xylan/chitin deacetylase (PgdA/CDA1 family)
MEALASSAGVLDPLPDGAEVGVALTFDFDADVGLRHLGLEGRMTSASELRFGAARGLQRLLELLAAKSVRGTFYVPGEIAERYPAAVREIDQAGHAIGHHGHVHLFNDRASEREQRDELERGIAALEDVVGRPVGYRSPGWELTPYSLDLLLDAGFQWDSSLMGDDRPYVAEVERGSILELPVHWSLDDWVYYGFQRDRLGHMSDPDAMMRVWFAEFESAVSDRRLVTYTMHPECSGRGYRALALERFIDRLRDRAKVWFASHAEAAGALSARE